MSDLLVYIFIFFVMMVVGFLAGVPLGNKVGYDKCKNEIECSGYVLHYHKVNSTNWVEVIKK